MPDDALAFTPIQFFDADFGPYILPVTPPGGIISQASPRLTAQVMGRAPGKLTSSGWIEISVKNLKERCHDYKTASLWEHWGTNVGFVAGDGYLFIDNDQGEEFSRVLQDVLLDLGVTPLRRFVDHPKHKRDAFLLRVLKEFIGDPAQVPNRDYTFHKGVMQAKVQILARNKQAVISGTHYKTKRSYVWNRKITGLHDIPVLTDSQFDEIIRKFMERLAADGWTVPQAPQPGTSSASPPPNMAIAMQPVAIADPVLIQNRLAYVGDLIVLTPNRIVPPGETPTKADLYLDDYSGWVEFTYMIAAAMGREVARTPEAEEFFVSWSNGRPQAKQPSRVLWRSVVNQLNWQFGDTALEKKVRELVPPNPPFPDDGAQGPPPKTPYRDLLIKEWADFSVKNGGFIRLKDCKVLYPKDFSRTFAPLLKELVKEAAAYGLKNPKTVAEIIAAQPDKLIVGGLTYATGDPPRIPDVNDPKAFTLNRWRKPEIEIGTGPYDIRPWFEHVAFIMETESDRFVRWCAYVAQFPQERPNWHFLVMGLPGLGKDTMAVPVKTAVGLQNAYEVEVHALHDNFNDAYESKLLILSETHQPSGQDAKKLNNRLKAIQAGPPSTIRINHKNLPPYRIPSRIAMMMFSNDINPVFLEPGDRRVHVLDKRHLVPKSKGYYASLWRWLNSGGAETVAAYLHSYALSDTDRLEFQGHAPASADKDALIQQNLNPAKSAFDELLKDAANGSGPFDMGLATVGQIIDQIAQREPKHRPTRPQVNGWLRDRELTGLTTGRCRKEGVTGCGAISAKSEYGRLWYVREKTPDGREWRDLTDAELLAVWRGKPMPSNAKVYRHPSASFPDDEPI